MNEYHLDNSNELCLPHLRIEKRNLNSKANNYDIPSYILNCIGICVIFDSLQIIQDPII